MTITDASGSVLGTYTSLKAFGNVIYSTSGMTNGSTYTVSVDGDGIEPSKLRVGRDRPSSSDELLTP